MKILQNTNLNQNNFKSRLNPIKPFTYKTSAGNLRIYEPSEKEIQDSNFIPKMVDFFFKNFKSYTKGPYWLKFNNAEFADEFRKFKALYYPIYENLFNNDDGHLTILLAKNEKQEICGGCLSYSFDEVPSAKDTTLYIDSLAVNKEYHKFGLGKILLEKSIDAGEKHFTDVFLYGEKLAEIFYKMLGFKPLNPEQKSQKTVIDYIAKQRSDYPDYVILFQKPLQLDKIRWYTLSANAIDNK